MIQQFHVFQSVDIAAMTKFIDSMQSLLEALAGETIPNATAYTQADLASYLTSLVKGQRGSIGQIPPGSWGVVPDDEDMGSDARVDFVFRPTYIATATLVRCLRDFPRIAEQIPGYQEALRNGLLFCSYRGLRGHGYEAEEGIREALHILDLGMVPQFLAANPDYATELKKVLAEIDGRPRS